MPEKFEIALCTSGVCEGTQIQMPRQAQWEGTQIQMPPQALWERILLQGTQIKMPSHALWDGMISDANRSNVLAYAHEIWLSKFAQKNNAPLKYFLKQQFMHGGVSVWQYSYRGRGTHHDVLIRPVGRPLYVSIRVIMNPSVPGQALVEARTSFSARWINASVHQPEERVTASYLSSLVRVRAVDANLMSPNQAITMTMDDVLLTGNMVIKNAHIQRKRKLVDGDIRDHCIPILEKVKQQRSD